MIYLDKKKYTFTQLESTSYPAVIMIIPSGWVDMYHVITEDPEEGDYYQKHEFMHKNKVLLRFGDDVLE